MLAFANEQGVGTPFKHANLLIPLGVMVVFVAVGFLVLALAQRLVPPARRAIKAPIARRRRLHHAATAELRSRAMMDELCPHGWQAEIILYSSAGELPVDAPDPSRTRVQLDWTELHSAAAVRTIWAQDVTEALEVMVADRVTEDTLHQIELRALADGASWPDA